MSIDDLYNNFKIVEKSVKKYVGASSGAQKLAFMTAPSTSSTNDANTTKPAYEVSTVSPNVNTASHQLSIVKYDRQKGTSENRKENFSYKLNTVGYDKSKTLNSKVMVLRRVSKSLVLFVIKKSDASKENTDDSLVKEQVSEDTSSFVKSPLNVDKETIFLDKKIEIVKPKNRENPVKKSVRLIVNTIKGKGWFTQTNNTIKAKAVNTARPKVVNTARPHSAVVNDVRGKPQQDDTGFIDSGCSRHMTGNIAYLSDFKEFDRGYVTFGGGAHGGRIFGKGTLKTDSLDFEDVYFVNELKFNLFSVSQMCDKKNYVLFTDTECLVLSPNFKLPDESQILLKIPRKDNMYSFDIKKIVFLRWGSLKLVLLQRLQQMNQCFGIEGLDETSEILKKFIKEIENLVDKKVKIIKSDNGTEFKNKFLDDFCREKGTNTNESAGTQRELTAGTSAQKMLIMVNQNLSADDQKQVEDGLDNKNDEKDKYDDDKLVLRTLTITGQQLITASPEIEPTSIAKALSNSSWVEAMQEELLQFKLQQVWKLVDLPNGKRAIGTKWVFRNKKDERGIVIRNKARYSPFELVAYTDSDYAEATQDRKSINNLKGFKFLGNRLISWQCKKQTMVATSTTEAEYVAAASCCGQVLWIQNQLLDYRYNFMHTMIHIDNNSTICIIENPVQHSKTKHIEIRHHFIRDCNAKKLIQMVKIDIEHNVADLLTKGFDAGRHVKRGRDTKIPQSSGPPIKVGDEAVHKELGDIIERAATTASSLEVEQDSGNINRTQFMATLNELNP
ncbi:ribonuclease H-like domain-containing protein [Tanacetum coccineum]